MNFKFTHIAILSILLLPVLASAQTYAPLVGIPGVDDAGNINAYINALYALSISIAALLAVIKIIIAGVKWMLSDIVTDKSEAKKDIWNATIGLIIVIAAVLILGVINPQLTETNVFVNQIEPRPQDQTRAEQYNLNEGESFYEVDNSAAGENRCTNHPYSPGQYEAGGGVLGQSICKLPPKAEDDNFEPRRSTYKCDMLGQSEYDCGPAETKCVAAAGIPEQAVGLDVNGETQEIPGVITCWPERLLCAEIPLNSGDGTVSHEYECGAQIALCKEGNGTEQDGMVFCN